MWKVFLRDLELWEAVTKNKHGVKLVQALSGPAKEACGGRWAEEGDEGAQGCL